jgi:hypothetical protein
MSEQDKVNTENTQEQTQTPDASAPAPAPEASTPEGGKAKGKAKEAAVAAPQEPIVLEDKYVTVKSKITGRRYIGAGWLSLEKDKELKVTVDQKRCLLEAGAIYL